MKTAVIGAGAMGSIYAALLADAGHEVWAVDTWRDHVEAIRKDGLHVDGASGDRVVSVHATCDPTEVGTAELVIIATKAMHVQAAAASAKLMLAPDTMVLAIQNGLGSVERIARVLNMDNVITGVAGGFGASVVKPGHVHHNGMQLIRFGESHGPITGRVERLTEIWRQAGFNVKAFDDIDQLVWEKLICNVCYSGTCGVLEMTVGQVMANDHAWRIATGCTVEAFDVARAMQIDLDFDDPVQYVRDFGAQMPNARPSLSQDLLGGRKTEIDVINGAIPPLARKLDMAVSFNQVITALVKAKEPASDDAASRV
jgi:2-dehydropantoate 2-reductase